MRLGSFTKTPAERKRYAVDYSDWLDTGETLAAYTVEVSPATASPLVVNPNALGPTSTVFVFFVSGGLDRTQYTVDIRMTTSGGQIKEDTILYTVREAS